LSHNGDPSTPNFLISSPMEPRIGLKKVKENDF
jgi:hypothetical protein